MWKCSTFDMLSARNKKKKSFLFPQKLTCIQFTGRILLRIAGDFDLKSIITGGLVFNGYITEIATTGQVSFVGRLLEFDRRIQFGKLIAIRRRLLVRCFRSSRTGGRRRIVRIIHKTTIVDIVPVAQLIVFVCAWFINQLIDQFVVRLIDGRRLKRVERGIGCAGRDRGRIVIRILLKRRRRRLPNLIGQLTVLHVIVDRIGQTKRRIDEQKCECDQRQDQHTVCTDKNRLHVAKQFNFGPVPEEPEQNQTQNSN